jgi:SAM-dependent methyltransferase
MVRSGDNVTVPSFDPVVDAYERGRPAYPDGLYDALGDLRGVRIVEGGAGTGIATRALRHRGASVVALDIGEAMLGRNGGMRAVADAVRMPVRDACVDLVCFAQAWHWLDLDVASGEVARVLDAGGRWAAWWNHGRDDRTPWFEAVWDVLESQTPGRRQHRDTDWGATLDRALFVEPAFTSVEWTREQPVDLWCTDERSKSYIGMQPNADDVMAQLESIVLDAFPGGVVRTRYETWLWQAERR